MTVHVIEAPAGIGKTSQIIDKLDGTLHQRVEFYVPTLALAQEIHNKLTTAKVKSRVVFGRGQPGNAKTTMCQKPALAHEISKLGYPVFPVICMGFSVAGDPHSRSACEHFNECSYLKQFEADERVLIFTHAYLPLPRNNKETIKPSLVVIDESFLSVCLETYELPRGELIEAISGNATTNAKSVVSLALKAFDDNKPLLDAFRSRGITEQDLKLALNEMSSTGATYNPCSTDGEFLQKLKKDGRARVRVDILVEVLIAELKSSRSASHGITFDAAKQILRVHYRKPITRFVTGKDEPTIVIIDANADIELIRPWFPDARSEKIVATRNAHVTQCLSTRGSSSSFLPDKHTHAGSRRWAESNLDGLQALIDRECLSDAMKWLIVGPQAVTGNPSKGVKPLITCPVHCALAHFNGLRGVDAYKDFDGVIIIGRNQPSINALEDLARSLWYDSPEPLAFASDWVFEERPYRMRDPSNAISVEVQVHPDQRIQRLHEQVREGESTQAIDRLRLIHATKAKRVIIISNIPLEIEVDELIPFSELAWQTRLDQAMDALKGVLPLNPEFLATRFPHLWPTPAAAKSDIARENQKDQIINNISINNLTLLNYEYRVSDQRRRSRALSLFAFEMTHTELSKHLGCPIVLRAIIDGKSGMEIFGAIGHARLVPMTAYGTGEPVPQPATPLPDHYLSDLMSAA